MAQRLEGVLDDPVLQQWGPRSRDKEAGPQSGAIYLRAEEVSRVVKPGNRDREGL